MKISDKKLLPFENLSKNVIRQQHFLYPLLFHKEFYVVTSESSIDKSNIKLSKALVINDRYSFLVIRRLIHRIRNLSKSKKILQISGSDNSICSKLDFYLVKAVNMVLETYLLIKSERTKKIVNWKSYKSIFSTCSFAEEKFISSNQILDFKIPHFIHPESFIRILRQEIKDVSFLHLTRFIAHEYKERSKNEKLIYSFSKRKRFVTFSWNFLFIFKLEFLLTSLLTKFINNLVLSNLFDQINPLEKISNNKKSRYLLSEKRMYNKNYCIHYVRYKNRFIMASEGFFFHDTNWIYYILKIWQYYMHFWIQPLRFSTNQLRKNNLLFLGYKFGLESKILRVRSISLDKSPTIYSGIKKNQLKIEIVAPIEFLTKQGFCDISGYPISRSTWTTLTDEEILFNFNKIWKNFSIYFGGLIKKDVLYRIKYILRFSCAKTLARKYKSTTRIFWKKIVCDLASPLGRQKSFHLFSAKDPMDKKRFWSSDITQMIS
uniref:Maturase K n=1 Tax=Equisetum bogotense TaxID=127539 RepID=A0A0F6PNC1_EQUBO|nr:maturase K [Equisetum bogotense]